MLFDTHAHFDHRKFDADREALLASLPEKNVSLLMNIGCDLSSSLKSVALSEQYPFIYCAVGSHPDAADSLTEQTLQMYRQLAARPKVRAIGEIGLDYHYEDVPRRQQLLAFEQQLELAQELYLPVVIHEREAHGDCLDVLRNHPKARGVFHCFSGSWEMAKKLTDQGWYLGFTGVITFHNARRAVEVAQKMPLDRMVIETDCPYMAPEPHRGVRNDSGFLRYMAQKLAELRGVSLEEMAAITTENGRRLFAIGEMP